MERIKKYFSDWGAARIIRMVLGVILGIAYTYNGEKSFLFFGLILIIQAAFNITCPGGSCSTGATKNEKPLIKTEKYEPKK
jgi:hypothetical protein